MKAYILTVSAAAIMSAFADSLVPKKWQKFVSLFTGALLLITIIMPILKLRGIELSSIRVPNSTNIEYDIQNEVETKLKKRVEEDIENRIKDEFGKNISAEAELGIKDGKIEGVKKIRLDAKKDERITARLLEVYDCKSIEYTR